MGASTIDPLTIALVDLQCFSVACYDSGCCFLFVCHWLCFSQCPILLFSRYFFVAFAVVKHLIYLKIFCLSNNIPKPSPSINLPVAVTGLLTSRVGSLLQLRSLHAHKYLFLSTPQNTVAASSARAELYAIGLEVNDRLCITNHLKNISNTLGRTRLTLATSTTTTALLPHPVHLHKLHHLTHQHLH